MSSAFDKFKEYVKNKKVAVIGIGISNRPLIDFLVKNGASVTAFDKTDEEKLGEVVDELKAMGVGLSLGENYLDNLCQELIFKTPGMRYDVPALEKARENDAVVTSEMEVFLKVCPGKIIAVTGSDGKTTTTTLIHKMLTHQGYKTWLGGNIGNPLLTKTDEIGEDDFVVLELSSFQLHTIKNSPHIAVITNISPNHLDVHKDYDEYIDAKKNIMLYQSVEDILVYNESNDVTAEIGKSKDGRKIGFSSKIDADICVKNNCIFKNGEEILKIEDIKLPGTHNVENYMAAIGAVSELVDKETISYIAKTFGGVEHRLEFVRELDGVKFYNSSIDSSPNRTINALSVFEKKIILIAGGKDKGIPYDDIGEPIENKVKLLILTGATADKINEAVINNARKKGIETSVKIVFCENYKEAVSIAKDNAKEGDVVLLSPASTSFDKFKNFEERGRTFKDIVNSF